MGCGSSAQVAAAAAEKAEDNDKDETEAIADETSPVSVKVTDENGAKESGKKIIRLRES